MRERLLRMGYSVTCHPELRIWTKDGTWEQILDHVIVNYDSIGTLEWTFSIDSTNVRAHQHAGARKKGGLHDRVGRTARGR